VTVQPSVWLVLRALYELARYDVVAACRGKQPVGWQLNRPRCTAAAGQPSFEADCEAIRLAACFYWKPVQCLQRSVCGVRLLRRRGIAARLVIGYRPVPFFCHAWIEVDGRIVNDSPAYQRRLSVLYTA
jgi:hypothetical protein